MNELWKDIPGYEGKYQASTLGRIRSIERDVPSRDKHGTPMYSRHFKGQILRPGAYTKYGHLSVRLGYAENGSPVHQLVMKTFVGDPPPGMEVLHINGNPQDNRLINLHYGTRSENILDVYRQGKKWRKLSVDDVEAIRFGLCCGIKGIELAAMFGVSGGTISEIKRGETFSWLR